MGSATGRARHALVAAALSQAIVLAFAHAPARAAELTPVEARWLQGALPVLQHARAGGLPLDVVVQPQPAAGEAPLAMAYLEARCKLTLTMRGNPAAQATLDDAGPALRDGVLELMAAHEVGHCLRHVNGRWHQLPAGASHAPQPAATLPESRRADLAQMRATRLEEAYADLAGLAWIAHMRPAQYAQLHGWLVRERSADLLPGSHHDTLAWLRLAEDPNVLVGTRHPFERVAEVWQRGVEALGAAP
jgi:hypothetical protein